MWEGRPRTGVGWRGVGESGRAEAAAAEGGSAGAPFRRYERRRRARSAQLSEEAQRRQRCQHSRPEDGRTGMGGGAHETNQTGTELYSLCFRGARRRKSPPTSTHAGRGSAASEPLRASTHSLLPWKSGTRASTSIFGALSLRLRIVDAMWADPWSGRSSRSTEVSTT